MNSLKYSYHQLLNTILNKMEFFEERKFLLVLLRPVTSADQTCVRIHPWLPWSPVTIQTMAIQ